MKKTFVLSLLLLAWSVQAMADGANYCANLQLYSHGLEQYVAKARCKIAQNLSWEDPTGFWKCQFNDKPETTMKALKADGIGYDFDTKAAFTEYFISPAENLGAFLFEGFGISGATGLRNLKTFFYESKPKLSGDILFFESDSDIYEIHVKNLKYCN